MLVSFYTVRVVLETLGVEDYGIYQVVGGVVAMFSFLNNLMAGALQRFLSFEIGRNEFDRQTMVFSLGISSQILIMAIVLLIGETAGLWFINMKLTVPAERMGVVRWIYQLSLISLSATIINTPYMALILAHEDMYIYTYMSILEVILKLVIVFLLRLFMLDKLLLYGVLTCLVSLICTGGYYAVCKIRYRRYVYKFVWDKKLFKEIMSFSLWNFLGLGVSILNNQGIKIALNQFFNPIVVAASSISSVICNMIVKFSANFSLAVKPQITKSFAAGKKAEMIWLMSESTKGTFFLLYLFTLPMVLEIPTIVDIWLTNPPEYLSVFTRLGLLVLLIDTVSCYHIIYAIDATGKIALLNSLSSIIVLLSFVVSIICLFLGYPAYSVMIVSIFSSVFQFFLRLIMLKKIVGVSITTFLSSVILPLCVFSVFAAFLPTIAHIFLLQNFMRLCIVAAVSIVSSCYCMYWVGLNTAERKKIKTILLRYWEVKIKRS